MKISRNGKSKMIFEFRKKTMKLIAFVLATIIPFVSVDLISYGQSEVEDITYKEYVDMNIKDYTTDYNENLEKKLNANGITDEMIEKIPTDYIEKILVNNGDVDVNVTYYKLSDNNDTNESYMNEDIEESLTNEGFEEMELVELSEDELDKLVNYVYHENDESKSSMFQKTTYAASSIYEDTQNSPTGMLALYSLMTYGVEDNGHRGVDIYSEAEWLVSPKNRGEDILGIVFKSDTMVDANTIERTYSYVMNDHSNPGIINKEKRTVPASSLPVACKGSAFYVKFNLVDDKNYYYVTDNIISVRAQGTVTYRDVYSTWANKYYWHKTNKISNSTTVEFQAGTSGMGINVYETISKTSVVSKCSASPYVCLVFK